MRWLLDTNIISYGMRGLHGIDARIAAEPVADLMTSSIVIAEGLAGTRRLPPDHPFHEGWRVVAEDWVVLDFDLSCAWQYAVLRHDLQTRGCMIGTHDCQIAATALAWQAAHPESDLTLVTDNEREFSRVPGLRVENWRG